MSVACTVKAVDVSSQQDTTSSDCIEEGVEDLVQALRSTIGGDDEERQSALDSLVMLLEEENEELVDTLIEPSSLALLMDCLEIEDDERSQVSSLMIFANITSGNKQQNQAVVNSGAVLPFIRLIDSAHDDISEQAVICVGNIACEDAFTRKVLYENGGLHAVLRFLDRSDLEAAQFNCGVWAFSNMCRSRTLISLHVLSACVSTIKTLLSNEDADILRSACAASAYLTDGPSDRIQVFLDQDVCSSILRLADHSDPLVVFSALRAISNFLSGSDSQIEELVALDVVTRLAHVLKRHKERRIVKEACMALSNIAAGSQSDILKIIEEGDLVEDLIHIARHAPLDVRHEATWALGNAIIGSGHVLINTFLTSECMKVMSAALMAKNPDLVKLTLQAIQNFLWCGDFGEDPHFDLEEWDSANDEDFWEHAKWLSHAHGIERLAKLRNHPDCEISQSSLQLLDALVKNPCGDYIGDAEDFNSSGDEESDYDDLLDTMTSPTKAQSLNNT